MVKNRITAGFLIVEVIDTYIINLNAQLKIFISLSIESYKKKCENESKSLSLDPEMIANYSCELSTEANTEKSSIIS